MTKCFSDSLHRNWFFIYTEFAARRSAIKIFSDLLFCLRKPISMFLKPHCPPQFRIKQHKSHESQQLRQTQVRQMHRVMRNLTLSFQLVELRRFGFCECFDSPLASL